MQNGRSPHTSVQLVSEAAFHRHPAHQCHAASERLHTTYEQLKQRRQKLDALRFGLDPKELGCDSYSIHSDIADMTDRRSFLSTPSSRQGMLQERQIF